MMWTKFLDGVPLIITSERAAYFHFQIGSNETFFLWILLLTIADTKPSRSRFATRLMLIPHPQVLRTHYFFFAICGGHERTVHVLLRHGPNPHLVTDNEGGTPLVTVFEWERLEIARLMIEAGKQLESDVEPERQIPFSRSLAL